MIPWLVGRCHVGEDHNTVRRYVLSRFKGGRAHFLTLPKPTKRAVFTMIATEHRENRSLYLYVMGGSQ